MIDLKTVQNACQTLDTTAAIIDLASYAEDCHNDCDIESGFKLIYPKHVLKVTVCTRYNRLNDLFHSMFAWSSRECMWGVLICGITLLFLRETIIVLT